MTTLIVVTRRAFQIHEAEKRGEDVILLTPAAQTSYWESQGINIPMFTVDDWNDYTQLSRLAVSFPKIDRILTDDEQCIAAAGFLRDFLGLPGQPFRDAFSFTDKAVMKKRLQAAGVPVAPFRVVSSLEEVAAAGNELGWPIVVKPRSGLGAINTYVIRDKEHLHDMVTAGDLNDGLPGGGMFSSATAMKPLAQHAHGFLVEKWQDVIEEYHSDIVVWDDIEKLAFTGQYITPVLQAVSADTTYPASVWSATRTEAVERTEELAWRAIRALNLRRGQVHAEVFRTRDGEYLLGEIACRPGGPSIPYMSRLVTNGEGTLEKGTAVAFDEEPPTAPNPDRRNLVGVGVPPQPGTVTRIPTEEDFRDLPGFAELIVHCSVGETLIAVPSVVVCVAIVLFESPSLDDDVLRGYAQKYTKTLADSLVVAPIDDVQQRN